MNNLSVSILTILGSGITSAVITYLLNSRKEERLFIRQKLEELPLALSRYSTNMASYLFTLRAMEGAIDLNEANSLMTDRETTREEKDALPTVERFIGIYFPDLEPQLNAILASRNKLANLSRSFQCDYRNGLTSNGPWLEPFRKEFVLSEKLINELKHDVVTHPIKTTQRKSIIP